MAVPEHQMTPMTCEENKEYRPDLSVLSRIKIFSANSLLEPPEGVHCVAQFRSVPRRTVAQNESLVNIGDLGIFKI